MLAGLNVFLKLRNYEALTVHEVKLNGKKDIEVVNYAKENGLVFITENSHASEYAKSIGVPCVWLSPSLKTEIILKEIGKIK
jgi:predicted nuclease of predicted toxin-antitoxin system